MSQSIKPIDVGTRIQNALRDAVGGKSGGYICPLCQESSHAGPKIWEHAKTAHPNSTDLMGCSDEAEAKRQFIERARKYFMVGGYVTIACDSKYIESAEIGSLTASGI
jgi:hypothetical protein